MPYKFKVDERVKVVRFAGPKTEYPAAHYLGKQGKVVTRGGFMRPYVLSFGRGVRMMQFDATELEAAPAKTRKKRGK